MDLKGCATAADVGRIIGSREILSRNIFALHKNISSVFVFGQMAPFYV